MNFRDSEKKRAPTFSIFFRFLLFVSIMCVTACSSDSKNTAVQANYIVQATISVEDDGPVAFALVMDGDKNLLDTLDLTINGESMTIEYFTETGGVSTETESTYPYYAMDLPDLKGGDMVVFEARDQFDRIIYAPEPTVIPMAVELLEPEEGQEIMEGDELLIRWRGGEGAEVFSAAYVALDGSAKYWDNIMPDASGIFTVPAGETVAGMAIAGVGAISGDTAVIETLDSEFITYDSYFLVSREVGIEINVRNSMEVKVKATGCPFSGSGGYSLAKCSCTLQFAALGIGAIVWETRRQLDLKIAGNKPCANAGSGGGALYYCATYGSIHGFAQWSTGCLACAQKTYFSNGQCWGCLLGSCIDWVNPRGEICRDEPCPDHYRYGCQ